MLLLATLASTQATPPSQRAGAGAELRQGPCMEGWTDGSAVGLGCLLADLEAWGDVETTGETACRHHGEGGRLVEVLDGDQMSFLQEMLGQMEADNQALDLSTTFRESLHPQYSEKTHSTRRMP